ncbi:MFS transporter [Alloscardovia macacae]|uniref:Sugar (Glycoside-Pentoside-Hexuronide) transporter n=1 Tax=Alloscardovia macacae TaxID=1160091 RepID=A0A261F734_9BIFI|nr:glycoside-pentoside-hexuronide (GPH):cation symporter [Alloscardovia macacae]OZG54942.1 sugar (Glycoside-Pentoside-Hexuronide) transporter [Alloscardovia macacae]
MSSPVLDTTASGGSSEMIRLSWLQKISYGLGAGGGNVMNTLLATFLLAYYTDTAGIAAASIGTMFVVCRFLDGITNFVMGSLIDNTHSRFGKARPWLFASAPLMLVGIVAIMNVPMGWSETAKLIYAYVSYLFLNGIVATMFGISHNALLARLTRDVDSRNDASMVSSVLNNVIGLAAGILITWLQLSMGWFFTSIVLGILTAVLILIPSVTLQEKVGMSGPNSADETLQKTPQPSLKEQLPAVLKNRYFWLSLLLGTLILFVNANAIGAQIFYCTVILHDPGFMTVLLMAGQIPGILVLFLMPYCARRFSKRAFMAAGAVLMIAGFALTGIAETNTLLIIVGTVLRSIGLGPMFAGLYAFSADSADYGEWKYGIRSEGLTASAQSIGSQIGIGFGSAATAWILAAVGYDPAAPVQSDAVVSAIQFDFGWMGFFFSIVLLVGVLLMTVEKYLPEIHASLGYR